MNDPFEWHELNYKSTFFECPLYFGCSNLYSTNIIFGSQWLNLYVVLFNNRLELMIYFPGLFTQLYFEWKIIRTFFFEFVDSYFRSIWFYRNFYPLFYCLSREFKMRPRSPFFFFFFSTFARRTGMIRKCVYVIDIGADNFPNSDTDLVISRGGNMLVLWFILRQRISMLVRMLSLLLFVVRENTLFTRMAGKFTHNTMTH